MNIMTKLKLVLFSLLLGMASVAGAGKPLFPGLQPMEEGRIQYLDLKTGELVVGDTAYRVDNKTAVRSKTGVPGSLNSLREGRSVRLYLHRSVLEGLGYETYVHGVELR